MAKGDQGVGCHRANGGTVADDSKAGLLMRRRHFFSWVVLASTVCGVAAQSPSPAVVRMDTGVLQGVVSDGAVSFKGIPSAAPPGSRACR